MEHFGPIPVDEQGRSYEIHHIDGNRDNNSIDNLMCVSVEDHLRIHLEQEDHYAAYLISLRSSTPIDPPTITPEHRERLSQRMKGEGNPMKDPKVVDKVRKALKGRKKNRSAEEKRLKSREGYKHSESTKAKLRKPKPKVTCPHCGFIGGASSTKRWHFNNCKQKSNG